MIKSCRLPRGCVVAGLTGLREAARHMVRICGVLEIVQMTGYASRARQVVIVIDVAIAALARRNGMRSRERESRGAVVEGRIGPRARAMALGTSLREA